MKKSRYIIALLLVVLAVGAIFFVACGKQENVKAETIASDIPKDGPSVLKSPDVSLAMVNSEKTIKLFSKIDEEYIEEQVYEGNTMTRHLFSYSDENQYKVVLVNPATLKLIIEGMEDVDIRLQNFIQQNNRATFDYVINGTSVFSCSVETAEYVDLLNALPAFYSGEMAKVGWERIIIEVGKMVLGVGLGHAFDAVLNSDNNDNVERAKACYAHMENLMKECTKQKGTGSVVHKRNHNNCSFTCIK